MKVYLDNAATTPLHPEVIEAMHATMTDNFGNPSSLHEFGRRSRTVIESARKSISELLNAAPKNIFFTSGGTEANNMIINSVVCDHKIKNVITSKISHPAVLNPLNNLVIQGKINLSYVKIDENGKVVLSDLKRLLENNERTFVSIMHANNEIGIIQDIKKIGAICNQYDAVFHSDTVQTIGHYPFDMQKLNINFLSASAHKFHGPKGVGFIYMSEEIYIKPLITGGGQERNMRAGTENIYGIVGLAKAIDIAYKNLEEDKKYIQSLKLYMINRLKTEFPTVTFYGSSTEKDKSLYTLLSVSFPNIKGEEMLLFNLDIMGIACSAGSACSSGSVKRSHVISIIDPDSTRPVIRFSFSKYNVKTEIDYTISKLKELFS